MLLVGSWSLGGNIVTASIANHPCRAVLHEKGMVSPVTSKQCIEGRLSAADCVADIRRNLGECTRVDCRELQRWACTAAWAPASASAAA